MYMCQVCVYNLLIGGGDTYLGYDVWFVEPGDVVLVLDGPRLDPDVRDHHRARTQGAAVHQAWLRGEWERCGQRGTRYIERV